MKPRLEREDLIRLVNQVFSLGADDKRLAILLDLPRAAEDDTHEWNARRIMAAAWAEALKQGREAAGLSEVDLLGYTAVMGNNADLPREAFVLFSLPPSVAELSASGKRVVLEEYLSACQLILAPTQYSATAPLKLLAPRYGFRAATMPGFTAEMIPALQLDYEEINRRVEIIKEILDNAYRLRIQFSLPGGEYATVDFDLRFRKAHASGGRFPQPGLAGNLPSGEAYIVPYEGERIEKSLSAGVLPVELEREVVLYRIQENSAVEVLSSGPVSEREREKIKAEPAYANIAELGFGVLGDFGLRPVGSILLDEKLGLHIAFGRSDHFGGSVGVKDFSAPDQVVHLDRIYLPETQPQVQVDSVDAFLPDGTLIPLMKDGKYLIFS